MANKELRRMSRSELIEIIYALEGDINRLEKENAELKSKLEEREIKIENAGSLAEAALSLNEIFKKADDAASDYLLSAKLMKEEAQKELDKAKKLKERYEGSENNEKPKGES